MTLPARRHLVQLLQDAHAGERAAAFAYRGHARSVRSEREREEIRRIEEDEWRHRAGLSRMLTAMGQRPRPLREAWMAVVGTFISWFCYVGGWFLPMYGAGKLERGNIVEYEVAARLAREAGYHDFVEPLLEMAEVEWDHELYFRTKAASHWLWRWMPGWSAPPPRSAIRAPWASSGSPTSSAKRSEEHTATSAQ